MKEDFTTVRKTSEIITNGDGGSAGAPSVGVDRVVGPQIRVDLV